MNKKVKKDLEKILYNYSLNTVDDISKIYWENICQFEVLSEDFVRELQDDINWHYVSIYQKLSESFIIEFKNKVNWNYISFYQDLSPLFIYKFEDKLDIIVLIEREMVTLEYLIKMDKPIIHNETRRYELIDLD